jgi:hypothetical protein
MIYDRLGQIVLVDDLIVCQYGRKVDGGWGFDIDSEICIVKQFNFHNGCGMIFVQLIDSSYDQTGTIHTISFEVNKNSAHFELLPYSRAFSTIE